MPLDAYLKKGLLKRQKVNLSQVEKQITRAKKDLQTAKLVFKNDADWAATIAYQSMLRTGRAYLFSKGYLPADGAQHRTVVELTGILLGKKFGLLILKFEKMRRQRNVFFYDSDLSGSKTDAESALNSAAGLIPAIENAIKAENPQYKFGDDCG